MTKTDQFTKPMQPCNADLDKIKFPCWVQKKWDGMKLIVRDGDHGLEFLGRSMKPIKNQWVVETLTAIMEPFTNNTKGFVFEGELQAGGCFENCDGLLSAKYREFDDLIYHVFDEISDTSLPYSDRQSHVFAAQAVINNPMFQYVGFREVHDMDQLMLMHQAYDADEALDGTIVRQHDMAYKAGKRTVNEGYVVKIKDFHDTEVRVTGVEEMMHNNNEAKKNPLGRTERSTAKDGLIPAGVLGALMCEYQGPEGPVQVKVGTGFDANQRAELWSRRLDLIGATAKIKYMRITKYGVPLHPVFLGFRDPIDMA